MFTISTIKKHAPSTTPTHAMIIPSTRSTMRLKMSQSKILSAIKRMMKTDRTAVSPKESAMQAVSIFRRGKRMVIRQGN